MNINLDEIDRLILKALQKDATMSVDDIGAAVNLSRNACWRRIKTMEQVGIITGKCSVG